MRNAGACCSRVGRAGNGWSGCVGMATRPYGRRCFRNCATGAARRLLRYNAILHVGQVSNLPRVRQVRNLPHPIQTRKCVYGISLVCFATSYTAALGLEVWRQFRPRRILYFLGLLFGAAGLATQSVYLAFQRPVGWMLILAWVLAVFYLYGALHYRRLAWGVFVLPVILGLLGLSLLFGPEADQLSLPDANRFWGVVHATLLLLAAVGVCVGFCASLMY